MGEMNWSQMRQDATTVLTGDFPVVIVGSEGGKSQNGKPMIKLKLRVESGPYAGREVRNNMTLSPENPTAVKMFFLNLERLGLGAAYFDANPDAEMVQIAADLLGRRAVVTLESRTWNGVASENVKTWKSALDGGAVELSEFGFAGMEAVELPAAVTTSTAPPDDPF